MQIKNVDEKKSNTAERLKYILKKRGMKQKDLIDLCRPYCNEHNVKLGKNYLSQYISGKVEPKQDKISIMAMALKVTETWLLGYGEDDEYTIGASNSKEYNFSENDFSKSVGERIKEAREHNKLSHFELSRRINIPVEQLQEMENGKDRLFNLELMTKLCIELNVGYDYFVNTFMPVDNVARNVAALRKIIGVSLETFANEIGISVEEAREYEDNNYQVPFSLIQKISNTCNLDVSFIIGTDFEKKQNDTSFIILIKLLYYSKKLGNIIPVDFDENDFEKVMSEIIHYRRGTR